MVATGPADRSTPAITVRMVAWWMLAKRLDMHFLAARGFGGLRFCEIYKSKIGFHLDGFILGYNAQDFYRYHT